MMFSIIMEALTFLFLTLLMMVESCPLGQSIEPCTCEWPSGESAYITCSGLDNEQDLVRIAGNTRGKNYIYSFVIENSVLNYIPSDAFHDNKFVELELKDSSLMALTDTDVAFEGMEDHLEILIMSHCTFMHQWDWSIFRNLRKLMRLEIEDSDLDGIEDFGEIGITSLKDIRFDRNNIAFIDPHAFEKFQALSFLTLSDNAIEEVARSMFPNPAPELLHLDLSNNRIEELPADIFTNMPKLEVLGISYNNILVLKESTFSPIWESLEAFSAMGNEIRCDCRMAWVLGKKSPKDVRAVCAQPKEQRGKNIMDLRSKDLWCFKK